MNVNQRNEDAKGRVDLPNFLLKGFVTANRCTLFEKKRGAVRRTPQYLAIFVSACNQMSYENKWLALIRVVSIPFRYESGFIRNNNFSKTGTSM